MAQRVLVFLGLLTQAGAGPAIALDDQADPFEAGWALIQANDITGALTMWIELRNGASGMPAGDPRVATAFVQIVAEHDLDRYQEMATEMFYWGYSGGPTQSASAAEEIMAEGRRTSALVDSATAAEWEALGRAAPELLSLSIKKFWVERDPTPTTLVNERLLEHWRRIAYARQNFVYNRSSPFDTDDRGVFHVKYGAPDRITRGTANISTAEQRQYNVSTDFVARFDRAPQYEIWRYATLHPGEFTYILFGNVGGTGPFQHVRGLHEILPPGARLPAPVNPNNPQSRRREIRPLHYLELLYYEDLARMGGPFGLRFAELERMWNQSQDPIEGALDATSRRYAEEDNRAARRSRPTSGSELDDSPKSALSAQLARFLHDGDPRLLAFAVSSPLWRPEVLITERGDSLYLAPYAAQHTVLLRDGHLDEIQRAGMVATDGEGNIATAVLRHVPTISHATVTARHDIEENSGDTRPAVFPGHVHFDVDEPLRLRAGEPEMSDLVLGIAPRPEIELGDIGIPLLPARHFWANDFLRIYFEIYHDSTLSEGTVQDLDVRVRILAENSWLPGQRPPPIGDEVQSTLSVALESAAPTGKHYLDLDLRNERPGELWIVVEVGEQTTGATRLRAAPFVLLDR